MPQYVKQHSWGEFVFDWSWAQAYRRGGSRLLPEAAVGRPVHAGHAVRVCRCAAVSDAAGMRGSLAR